MYESFSQVYDIFMDDIPYDKWCEYIVKLLRKEGISGGKLVELGCGTGKITRRLRDFGYDMTGIDISEEMLDIASKSDSKDILYVNMDMSKLKLPYLVDGIVSVCDSVNYLMDEDALFKTFARAYDSLRAGGVFIFDLKSEYFYRSILGDKTFAENRDEASLIWQNYYYDDDMINEYELTIFAKNEDGTYRKYEENQYQRAYSLDTVVTLLNKLDFSSVMVYNAFTNKKPTNRTPRYYFVCKK